MCAHNVSGHGIGCRAVHTHIIYTDQGLIQDFLLGGETVFLKKFWIFSDSRTDEFSYNNFSNSIFIGYRPV